MKTTLNPGSEFLMDSNKFVIDSNHNNTEVPADLLEEQASQLKMKDFAARSKAKAKPQRKEPVELPSIIPMNERKWIDIEPGDSSLSAYEISKKVINLLRHSQTVQREDDGAVQFWRMARGMGSPRHVLNRRRRTREGPELACVQTPSCSGVAHAGERG